MLFALSRAGAATTCGTSVSLVLDATAAMTAFTLDTSMISRGKDDDDDELDGGSDDAVDEPFGLSVTSITSCFTGLSDTITSCGFAVFAGVETGLTSVDVIGDFDALRFRRGGVDVGVDGADDCFAMVPFGLISIFFFFLR